MVLGSYCYLNPKDKYKPSDHIIYSSNHEKICLFEHGFLTKNIGLYHSVSMVNLLRQYHGFDVRKTIYNLFNSNKYYNAKY